MWQVGETMGRTFFVAGLLPALAFLAACDLLLLPGIGVKTDLSRLEVAGISAVFYIAGGLFLGFLLLALNTPIVHLYERGVLISRWLQQRNQKQCRERHTSLAARRAAYLQVREQGPGAADADGAALEDAIARLEGAHQAIEHRFPGRQRWPHDCDFVRPTALGNAFAVIEEYPFERYGMDAMIYWPHLVDALPEQRRMQIGDLKTTLDFLLNLSLLAAVFGLAALGVSLARAEPREAVAGVVALGLAYGVYRAGVLATYELGSVITGSFDLYREGLAKQLGYPRPASLAAEQRFWRLLASFLRRGEDFYLPTAEELGETQFLLQQELSRHTHNVHVLRHQAAIYAAGETPLHLLNQIEVEQNAIDQIRQQLIAREAP